MMPAITPTRTILIAADKARIIEHLNEEHQEELIGFAEIFATDQLLNEKKTKLHQVNITQIYQEGIQIEAFIEDKQDTIDLFINFLQPIKHIDDLQYQYIALMQRFAKKMGKDSIKIAKQSFTVLDNYLLTQNMRRLVLYANDQTPLTHQRSAGYAYLFNLASKCSIQENMPSREHCYYTLRKVFEQQQRVMAWVDIYIHGKTSGGSWAQALQANDLITSKREFPEKVEHLNSGQALLIADETSLPTVARLLELWNNPTPPIIISITNRIQEQSYLANAAVDEALFNSMIVLPLVINYDQTNLTDIIETTLANYLEDNPIIIEKVWGALEAKTVKLLRRKLQDRLNLSRTDCVLKVYWRQD